MVSILRLLFKRPSPAGSGEGTDHGEEKAPSRRVRRTFPLAESLGEKADGAAHFQPGPADSAGSDVIAGTAPEGPPAGAGPPLFRLSEIAAGKAGPAKGQEGQEPPPAFLSPALPLRESLSEPSPGLAAAPAELPPSADGVKSGPADSVPETAPEVKSGTAPETPAWPVLSVAPVLPEAVRETEESGRAERRSVTEPEPNSGPGPEGGADFSGEKPAVLEMSLRAALRDAAPGEIGFDPSKIPAKVILSLPLERIRPLVAKGRVEIGLEDLRQGVLEKYRPAFARSREGLRVVVPLSEIFPLLPAEVIPVVERVREKDSSGAPGEISGSETGEEEPFREAAPENLLRPLGGALPVPAVAVMPEPAAPVPAEPAPPLPLPLPVEDSIHPAAGPAVTVPEGEEEEKFDIVRPARAVAGERRPGAPEADSLSNIPPETGKAGPADGGRTGGPEAPAVPPFPESFLTAMPPAPCPSAAAGSGSGSGSGAGSGETGAGTGTEGKAWMEEGTRTEEEAVKPLLLPVFPPPPVPGAGGTDDFPPFRPVPVFPSEPAYGMFEPEEDDDLGESVSAAFLTDEPPVPRSGGALLLPPIPPGGELNGRHIAANGKNSHASPAGHSGGEEGGFYPQSGNQPGVVPGVNGGFLLSEWDSARAGGGGTGMLEDITFGCIDDVSQITLRAVFGTDQWLTPQDVVDRCARLAGLKACVLLREVNPLSSAGMPPEEAEIFLAGAARAQASLKVWTDGLGVADGGNFTLHTDHGVRSFFPGDGLCLVVWHDQPVFAGGTREKLILAARELSCMTRG